MVDILLPKIGFSMTEGNLTEWLAKDGDKIEKGQPLFSFESDKSIQEVEAQASGTLKIIGTVDTVYEVGTVIGRIV